jgi:hypothetical protein
VEQEQSRTSWALDEDIMGTRGAAPKARFRGAPPPGWTQWNRRCFTAPYRNCMHLRSFSPKASSLGFFSTSAL